MFINEAAARGPFGLLPFFGSLKNQSINRQQERGFIAIGWFFVCLPSCTGFFSAIYFGDDGWSWSDDYVFFFWNSESESLLDSVYRVVPSFTLLGIFFFSIIFRLTEFNVSLSNRNERRTVRAVLFIFLFFTWFDWVLPGITEFYRVLPGFTGFYRVLSVLWSFHRVLSGSVAIYRSFTGLFFLFWGFDRVWNGFTGFYRVLRGFSLISTEFIIRPRFPFSLDSSKVVNGFVRWMDQLRFYLVYLVFLLPGFFLVSKKSKFMWNSFRMLPSCTSGLADRRRSVKGAPERGRWPHTKRRSPLIPPASFWESPASAASLSFHVRPHLRAFPQKNLHFFVCVWKWSTLRPHPYSFGIPGIPSISGHLHRLVVFQKGSRASFLELDSFLFHPYLFLLWESVGISRILGIPSLSLSLCAVSGRAGKESRVFFLEKKNLRGNRLAVGSLRIPDVPSIFLMPKDVRASCSRVLVVSSIPTPHPPYSHQPIDSIGILGIPGIIGIPSIYTSSELSSTFPSLISIGSS